MTPELTKIQQEIKDVKAAIAILATAFREQPRPPAYMEATGSHKADTLSYTLDMLREVGSNGELHQVVEFYKQEVQKS